ncbi:MAG: TetR/AcrR family transcriptional regulator [Proteobacteria bacterium]|nr:MAG: TetR/AcrR family transcriptional regulator [Pseudomonadota bacterium]
MPPDSKRTAIRPRKEPKQARSRQTVADILQAATYILQRRGYDGMNTNAVAERAGVNVASLYQYFPNKQAILVELMRRHAAESRAAALEAFRSSEGETAHTVMHRIVAAGVAAHAVDPALHRIFTEEAARLGLAPFETDSDAMLATEGAAWATRMGTRRKNPELALWVATTAAHAVMHAAFVERPADATSPELVEELTLLLGRYLAPGTTQRPEARPVSSRRTRSGSPPASAKRPPR